MPKPKSSKSLVQISLDSVLNTLFPKEESVEGNKSNACLITLSRQFNSLPSSHLVQIAEKLRKKFRCINVEQMSLFMTSHTRALDFFIIRENMGYNNYCHLLQLASIRCPKLQTLWLRSSPALTKDSYVKCLPMFKQLQELNVAFNKGFDDTSMEILGIHCRDLRILNIYKCDVSDSGIESLCGGSTEEEQKKLQGGRGQCKSLENLLIEETKITHLGVQLALRNLPDLKTIDHSSVIEALTEVHHNQQPLPKYALISLQLIEFELSTPYRNGSLGLAASICPFVSNLTLHLNELTRNTGITDEELLGLLSIKSLKEFTISGFFPFLYHSPITFNSGIVPLLKAQGMSLQYLKICTSLFSVDVAVLIELCPNLRYLKLDCRYVPTSRDEPPNPKRTKTDSFVLNQLETLEIMEGFDGFPIPSDNFLRLLCAVPTLTSLVLEYCPSLSDDVIQKVFECHSFPCLKNLELEYCNFVSKKGIDLFMNEGNCLETINIVQCPLVKQENVDEWRAIAEKNNWNLSVDFYWDAEFAH